MENKKSVFKKNKFFTKKLNATINHFLLLDKNNELNSPEYQRGYVWELENKIELIESIFDDIEIGRIFLHENFDFSKDESTWVYDIIDGKQRLSAIINYFNNEFFVRGVFYKDLSISDQRKFKNTIINLNEVKNLSLLQQKKLFIKANTTGKIMDKKHLLKIKKEINKNGK